MRRRLFNILACTSLLLFVVAVASWVDGERRTRAYVWGSTPAGWSAVGQGRGQVGWVRAEQSPGATASIRLTGWVVGPPEDLSRAADAVAASRGRRRPGGIGFSFARGQLTGATGTVRVTIVAVPHWFLAAATVALPALWLLRRRPALRRHRLAHGLCPSCGYDLRASPDRCPECGEVVRAQPSAGGAQ